MDKYRKKLTWMAILPLILSLMPSVPVHGNPATTLTVSPARTVALTGTSFTVAVNISDVSDFVAYDISLKYNSAIITTSVPDVTLAGTLFNMTTCGTPPCYFPVATQVFNSLGTVRVAVTLLGLTTSVAPTDSKPLVFIKFKMVGVGTTALTIADDTTVCAPGGVVQACPHTDVNGLAQTPPQIILARTKSKSSVQVLDISKGLLTTSLLATIENTGSITAFAKVQFVVVSSGGNTTFATTLLAEVPGGATITIGTTWTAQGTPDLYTGISTLLRSPDGSIFVPGESDSFKFKVDA